MSNKSLWDRVKTTDPTHVKKITGKQYQGNSPKPYWIVERLTDEFGPCGIGWGFRVVDERMERLAETEILHVARVLFWYELGGKRGEFEQIGQTRAMYAKKDGALMVDEDAPKKSVTDALVKCASYLGFAGDIFSGLWDDSKYVEEAGMHWEVKRSTKAFDDWMAEISSAATLEKLSHAYNEATHAACGDEARIKRVKAATKARKSTLEGAATKPAKETEPA